MTDLEKIRMRREELRSELADLDVAERVLLALSGGSLLKSTQVSRARRGASSQYDLALGILNENGGRLNRPELFEELNKRRDTPMGEPTYAAFLSKMKSAGYIERDGSAIVVAQKQESSPSLEGELS